MTVSSSPALRIAVATTESSAMNPTKEREEIDAEHGRYQCGVSDMIQSTEAKVWVSARTMMPARRICAAGPTPIPRHVLTARAASRQRAMKDQIPK